MQEFNEGDIVTLKSGGPDMTIESIMLDRCICTWFYKDKNDIQRSDKSDFALIALEKVDFVKREQDLLKMAKNMF